MHVALRESDILIFTSIPGSDQGGGGGGGGLQVNEMRYIYILEFQGNESLLHESDIFEYEERQISIPETT